MVKSKKVVVYVRAEDAERIRQLSALDLEGDPVDKWVRAAVVEALRELAQSDRRRQ